MSRDPTEHIRAGCCWRENSLFIAVFWLNHSISTVRWSSRRPHTHKPTEHKSRQRPEHTAIHFSAFIKYYFCTFFYLLMRINESFSCQSSSICSAAFRWSPLTFPSSSNWHAESITDKTVLDSHRVMDYCSLIRSVVREKDWDSYSSLHLVSWCFPFTCPHKEHACCCFLWWCTLLTSYHKSTLLE